MNPELSLLESLHLLAIEDKKGHFLPDSIAFPYCLGGAALLELSLLDKIEVVGNKVIVKDHHLPKDALLSQLFSLILNKNKAKSLRYWIEVFGNKSRKIRRTTVESLISKGILSKKDSKILWVIPNPKYPTANPTPELNLRKRLTNIITTNELGSIKDIMLISLVDTCKLNSEVYGKKQAKLYKNAIKKLLTDNRQLTEVGKTVKQIHDLIIVLIVVMITSTTVTTS
jgi:hypothetical protein